MAQNGVQTYRLQMSFQDQERCPYGKIEIYIARIVAHFVLEVHQLVF